MELNGGRRVLLVPWAGGDMWLLRRCNTPEMTDQLGGPESEEQLVSRHRRYCEPAAGRMYRVVLDGDDGDDGDGETVGSIGYWEHEWQGGTVWETGWAVLPEYQGRGLAVSAARALIGVVREAGGHPTLHAFPKVDHSASNGVCRKAGFTLRGQADFEYPKGNPIRSNDWYVDLRAGLSG
ncbi:GNAT family N-acetyltransferase [Streptomyces antibioticus]|uniref:GNAT family N-acetyltransferase n=1 Tax=Streptomyces antibioticus TaxID=1890 RepID=UPI00224DF8D4|nr:GNAT family N-acetyltransferase [Streptomyces antibioticus]MCX4739450.1 GNAT family N-acetyltransferase [Streptomyces antibioticus]